MVDNCLRRAAAVASSAQRAARGTLDPSRAVERMLKKMEIYLGAKAQVFAGGGQIDAAFVPTLGD